MTENHSFLNNKKTPVSESVERVYEFHHMKQLPLIFHYDVVCNPSPAVANWHENIEILSVIEGEGTLISEGEATVIQTGDIVVIDSHLLHRVETTTKVVYYCLIIDESFLQENGIAVQNRRFCRRIHDTSVREQYNKIVTALRAEDEFKVALVRAEVLQLMVLLLRHFCLPDIALQPSKTSLGIRKAIGYIHSHFAEQLSLETLSSLAGFSKYHFVREFGRATGYTPLEYIHAVRIERACRLLESERYSVAEVSAACGFSTPSYFSKLFFKLRGVVPSRWNKERV